MLAGFLLGILLYFLLAYAMGFVTLKLLRFPLNYAFAGAPAFTICIMGILALIYGKLGILCNIFTIYLAPLAVLLAIVGIHYVLAHYVLARHVHSHAIIRPLDLPPLQLNILLLYLACGIVMGIIMWVSALPTLDGTPFIWDEVTHINGLRSFAQSGIFSAQKLNNYVLPSELSLNPFKVSTGFYPTGWLSLGALTFQLIGAGQAHTILPAAFCLVLNVSPTVIINVSVFVFTSIIFPLSCATFFCLVFKERPRIIQFGAVACVSFAMFPWILLNWGIVYPFIAALCLAPFGFALIIVAVRTVIQKNMSSALLTWITLAFYLIGGSFTHPSLIFYLFIFGSIFVFCNLSALLEGIGIPQKAAYSWISKALFVVVTVFIWNVMYRLPFLQATINQAWNPNVSMAHAVVKALVLNLHSFVMVSSPQVLLGLLVFVGLIAALRTKEYRWLSLFYLCEFVAFIVVNAVGAPSIRYYLVGFWYNDINRIASLFALSAMPLAALGFDTVCSWVTHLFNHKRRLEHKRLLEQKVTAILGVLVILCLAFPSIALPQLTITKKQNAENAMAKAANTPETLEDNTLSGTAAASSEPQTYQYQIQLGALATTRAITSRLRDYSQNNFVSLQKRVFWEEVRRKIGDAIVINMPYDGSMFAYGLCDLRTVYRYQIGYNPHEEVAWSELLRTQLNELTTNAEVQNVVRATGAQYVMTCGPVPLGNLAASPYQAKDWVGIEAITPATPGFELVLQDGDLCLYQIVG